jgi:hypothetical protein
MQEQLNSSYIQANPLQADPVRLAIVQKIKDHQAHIENLERMIKELESVLPQFPESVAYMNAR